MYKRILVPVDGSAASMQGLREAIKLASVTQGTLRIVHILDEYIFDPDYGLDYNAMRESFRISGAKVLARAQALVRAAGVEFESEMIETVAGGVAALILKAADHWHADLIVMGTHGRRGLRRLTLGSDAETVVRSAQAPVLLVRAESQPAAAPGNL